MIAVYIIAAIALATFIFINSKRFGSRPKGVRKARVQQSPNYDDGQFQNLHFTPSLTEGVSMPKVLVEFFFKKRERSKPAQPLPTQKTNLKALRPEENVLVWFGHSSYFMQVDGKTFLADPVFSGYASPVPATTRAFKGSDIYTADEMPVIDYLLVSHDHWDHLDYKTVLALKPKVKAIVTGLGVAQHFERWGFEADKIIEKDWNETAGLAPGFTIYTAPARHFSGRGLKRNTSLWLSFVLKTPNFSLYLGGDSGYDTHFKAIGEKYGPFDLAVLECGQYDPKWKYIHMMPEETVKAAQELRAKRLLPVHWAKFSLALHSWDEPIQRVTAEAGRQDVPIATPMIGEQVVLGNEGQEFSKWWEGLE